MLRADTIAPIFNYGEKRACVTTQVDKGARDGYRLNDAGPAFWAGGDRATTLVAGAGHVGTSWMVLCPAGSVPAALSTKPITYEPP